MATLAHPQEPKKRATCNHVPAGQPGLVDSSFPTLISTVGILSELDKTAILSFRQLLENLESGLMACISYQSYPNRCLVAIEKVANGLTISSTQTTALTKAADCRQA